MDTSLLPGGRHAQWQPTTPIRWLLLDVDGTLLGPGGRVTQEVIDATRAAAAAGLRVGYATGRNTAGVAEVHAALDLPGPHIVLNGAQVREDGKVLDTFPLTSEQRGAILQLCDAEGLYAELYTDGGVVVTAMDERFKPHWDLVIGQPIGTVADLPDELDGVIKTTIVATDSSQLAMVVAAVEALGLSAGPATSPVTPGLTYVNITRADVDKGTAITSAAARLGIELSQVAVVGDSGNDLPMLAVAGTAIAMGDAEPEIHAAAHLVTHDVKDDGAAAALRDVLRWGLA